MIFSVVVEVVVGALDFVAGGALVAAGAFVSLGTLVAEGAFVVAMDFGAVVVLDLLQHSIRLKLQNKNMTMVIDMSFQLILFIIIFSSDFT